MVLDDEEHRDILLQLINRGVFPGEFAEKVVDLKKAVQSAAVENAPANDEQAAA